MVFSLSAWLSHQSLTGSSMVSSNACLQCIHTYQHADITCIDSVYTERYMLTPQLNADGYEKSAVRNMTGFNHTQYLLVHGTGDDNGRIINVFD
jgi:hypothetical protein